MNMPASRARRRSMLAAMAPLACLASAALAGSPDFRIRDSRPADVPAAAEPSAKLVHPAVKTDAGHPVADHARHPKPWVRQRVNRSDGAALQVRSANAAARIEPSRDGYVNGIQQYPYADGSLYEVYAAPARVTDIALQEGEELAGSGPVAAGDTVRWIIGDTTSGAGATKRVHILVKPARGDISTNLIINTDRRTYHIELNATAATYMASVSWTYPLDALVALRRSAAERAAATPVAAGIDAAALNFDYRLKGGKPGWRPVRVFDDGRRVMIEFPPGVATSEMPPLFVAGEGGALELVNYRVQGRYMVVDRLFDAAELRIGTKKTKQAVRIEREGARLSASRSPA